MEEYFFDVARYHGRECGNAVIRGDMSAELAGDQWKEFADADYELGQEFIRGYDSTGAER